LSIFQASLLRGLQRSTIFLKDFSIFSVIYEQKIIAPKV
jgi:hypothetical protein